MTFACCLQIPNHLHFKRFSSIWAEFIPQLIFLESIFGYLVVMIIKKWCTDWSAPGAGNPPSLLNMLIYMFLSPGTVEDPMYAGQSGVQMFLLGLAGICVPWMLCTKPYLQWREHQKTSAAGYVGVSANDHEEDGRRSSIDDTEEEGNTNGRGGVGAGPVDSAGEEEEHVSFSPFWRIAERHARLSRRFCKILWDANTRLFFPALDNFSQLGKLRI